MITRILRIDNTMATAKLITFGLLAFNGVAHTVASPLVHKRTGKPCTSFTVPISITAQNHLYDLVQVNSNLDAVHYAQDLDTWDSPTFPDRIVANVNLSTTYDIFMTLCVPINGNKSSYLQIATHGGQFDSRYWDAQVNPQEHSYVDAALAAGYSILTYDRIGCGQSTHPDFTEPQAPAEVEVLRGVTEMARNGTLMQYATNLPGSFNPSIAFDKVIHIGHSYGSFVTYTLTSMYPELSDGVQFTGDLFDKELAQIRITAVDSHYALEDDPVLFANSSTGYVVSATASTLQTNFFSSRVNETTNIGGFEPEVLKYAFSIRQPVTTAQLGSATVALERHPTAPNFKGPVLFMCGEFDFLICLGDCRNSYDMAQLNAVYPQAKSVEVYLQPGTGHALPFHNDAQLGFQHTFQWLDANGL